MKKKVFVLTAVFAICVNFFIFQPFRASAMGWDNTTRIEVGTTSDILVRAIGERIGLQNLSGKVLSNVEGYISKKAIDGNATASNFIQALKSSTGNADPLKTGFSKYILNPDLWLTGADLIMEAYNAFNNAYTGSTSLPIACYGDVVLSTWHNTTSGYWYPLVRLNYNGNSYTNDSSVSGSWTSEPTVKLVAVTNITGTSNVKTSIDYTVNGTAYNLVTYWKLNVSTYLSNASYINTCNVTPTASDVPNITNVNSVTNNYFNTYNAGDPTTITYQMVVDAPTNPTNTDPTLWNSVDDNLPTVLEPPDTTAPNEVSGLVENHTNTTVDLNWTMPTDKDFSYVRIFRDGSLIADSYASTNYHDSGLSPSTNHEYKITTVDAKGNESTGNKISVTLSDEPVSAPSDGSGGWWKWLLKPIFDFISGINDLFKSLFVPDGDSISNQFADLSDSFKAKIPITGQLGDFWGGLKGAVTDGQKVPKFDISFPKDWGGGTYSIIDFSYFTDYRTWILNFIRFSAWFLFLKRLYNKIASLI